MKEKQALPSFLISFGLRSLSTRMWSPLSQHSFGTANGYVLVPLRYGYVTLRFGTANGGAPAQAQLMMICWGFLGSWEGWFE